MVVPGTLDNSVAQSNGLANVFRFICWQCRIECIQELDQREDWNTEANRGVTNGTRRASHLQCQLEEDTGWFESCVAQMVGDSLMHYNSLPTNR